MIQLKITMKSGQFVTRNCQTQQEADEYLSYISTNHNWGKPDRWVREGQEDTSQAIENKTIVDQAHIPAVIDTEGNTVIPEVPEMSHIEYHLAAEYTVEQTDITNDLKLAKIRELRAPLLEKADILINISQDKNQSNLSDLRSYRQSLRDVTDAFKADMSLLASIDPDNFVFPSKPS